MPEKTRTHRPPGVTLVGGLTLAQAVFRLAVDLAKVVYYGWALGGVIPWPEGLSVSKALDGLAIGTAVILHAILLIVSGIGLLRMRPSAWLWAMALQGIGLATGLIAYVRGQPNYLAMTVAVVIVLLLNQNDVQAAFRRSPFAGPAPIGRPGMGHG